jgi:hypothetical protein
MDYVQKHISCNVSLSQKLPNILVYFNLKEFVDRLSALDVTKIYKGREFVCSLGKVILVLNETGCIQCASCYSNITTHEADVHFMCILLRFHYSTHSACTFGVLTVFYEP